MRTLLKGNCNPKQGPSWKSWRLTPAENLINLNLMNGSKDPALRCCQIEIHFVFKIMPYASGVLF